jgi:hypothetical protein
MDVKAISQMLSECAWNGIRKNLRDSAFLGVLLESYEIERMVDRRLLDELLTRISKFVEYREATGSTHRKV